MKFGTTASVAALAMAISLVDGGVALAVEGGARERFDCVH